MICGHAAQDRRRERLGDGAHAHQHRRLERLDRLGQRAHERHVVRVRQLVVRRPCARLAHEALRVHEPALLARLLLADALEARRRHEQVADARAGLAGAQEQQALLRELLAREAQARDHAGDRTAAVPWMSSLNEQMRSRYFWRRRNAFWLPKSSHWSSALGKRS